MEYGEPHIEAVARIILKQDGHARLYADLSDTGDPWDVLSEDFKTTLKERAVEVLDSLRYVVD